MPHSTARPTSSDEVRRAFLAFFEQRGHRAVPSSSLVPHNDPTVLLTTAGVQQFIPFMLGKEPPPCPRLVSVQKCFRTTDIDEVGNPRTLTFFEMLGNFSVGEYFKAEAIAWAWDFSIRVMQFPPERVYITVHPTDEEAVRLWLAQGVPQERISAQEDNWWGPPGVEGPCGPDSELYFDRGPALGCGRPTCAPGCSCDRFLEFWNLVFTEFYQDRAGTRTPLPRKNIDTGMGLERLAALAQDVPTVYETDLFRPIMDGVARLVGKEYGRDPKVDFSLRVIADHGRAMTFLVADGVLPGNAERPYICRRVIRRAVRYGRLLGIQGPFLRQVVDLVVARMRAHYPALETQHRAIVSVVEAEERQFSQTLESGTARLERFIQEALGRGERCLSGELLFRLYDSYGFPLELSEEVLRERGMEAEREGFQRAMEEARRVSRGEALFRAGKRIARLEPGVPPTEFLGYQTTEAAGNVLAIAREDEPVLEASADQEAQLVLERTPFYAEGGGQVGDQGSLVGPEGVFQVEDTQRDEAGHIVHLGRVRQGVLRVGQEVQAQVDRIRRDDTMRHHTITHILHRALREVLGEGAAQRGSLVSPDVARFDFNYPAPLAGEQLEQVTRLINERVLENLPVTWRIVDLDEARKLGADMFFGEKYGERVRVVQVGNYSKELCGGTHASRSGDIGMALILRQESAGAGLRRLYVVAGRRALEASEARGRALAEVAEALGTSVEVVPDRVRTLLDELKRARREAARAAVAGGQIERALAAARSVNGVQVVASQVEAPSEQALREMVDTVRARVQRGVVALGTVLEGKPVIVIGITRDLAARPLDAGKLVKQVAALTGGGGGGRPDMARGGGTNPARLGDALERVYGLVEAALAQ
ncbi:MAG: alanine--tRNA ligase [Chloroflexi bacterium]|nr:alanine--tRNA ligase [Chloroflexota bacterium]